MPAPKPFADMSNIKPTSNLPQYNWFGVSMQTGSSQNQHVIVNGGAIVMYPATRKRLVDIDVDDRKAEQLYDSLKLVHDCGIAQGDIRWENCAYFEQNQKGTIEDIGWQIIDFDHASLFDEKSMTKIPMCTKSNQYKFSSENVKQQTKAALEEYAIQDYEVSRDDEFKMLHNSFINI